MEGIKHTRSRCACVCAHIIWNPSYKISNQCTYISLCMHVDLNNSYMICTNTNIICLYNLYIYKEPKYNATFSSPNSGVASFAPKSSCQNNLCLQFLSRQILWLWLHGSASNRATWGKMSEFFRLQNAGFSFFFQKKKVLKLLKHLIVSNIHSFPNC